MASAVSLTESLFHFALFSVLTLTAITPMLPAEVYGNYNTIGINVPTPSGYTADQIKEARVYLVNGLSDRRLHDAVQIGDIEYFATSVFGLTPGTAYDFRVEFYDTGDMLVHTDTFSGSTRPEPGPVPAAQAEIHVAVTGSDTTGDGSAANPYLTVEHGLSELDSPGEHLVIHEGVYYEGDFDFFADGTAADPIVIRAADGENVILDGSDPNLMQASAWTVEGNGYFSATTTTQEVWNVCVRNGSSGSTERLFPTNNDTELTNKQFGDGTTFAFRGDTGAFHASSNAIRVYHPSATPSTHEFHVSRRTAFITLETVHDVRITGLTFRYYGAGMWGKAIYVRGDSVSGGTTPTEDVVIENCIFRYVNCGVLINHRSNRITVQDCEFHDALNRWGFLAKSQPASHYNNQIEGGAFCISPTFYGRGCVFRNCLVDGTFEGCHLGAEREVIPANEPIFITAETDCYGNEIYNTCDDFLEFDGYARNVRCFNNTMQASLTGISCGDATDGPVFIVRNICGHVGSSTAVPMDGNQPLNIMKGNGGISPDVGSGHIFVYHNTYHMYPNPAFAWIRTSGTRRWKGLHSKNNIYIGLAGGFKAEGTREISTNTPIDMEADILYDATGANFCMYEPSGGGGTHYSTRPEALAGISDVAFLAGTIATDPALADPVNGDYSLSTGSPAIDAGVIIPGINDLDFNGAAPDIGAVESSSNDSVSLSPAALDFTADRNNYSAGPSSQSVAVVITGSGRVDSVDSSQLPAWLSVSGIPAMPTTQDFSITVDPNIAGSGVSDSVYGPYAVNLSGSPSNPSFTVTVIVSDNSGSADSDSDGMPDDWETQYFGDTGQAAGGDPDGDGNTNIEEYRAGTDPTVVSSKKKKSTSGCGMRTLPASGALYPAIFSAVLAAAFIFLRLFRGVNRRVI